MLDQPTQAMQSHEAKHKPSRLSVFTRRATPFIVPRGRCFLSHEMLANGTNKGLPRLDFAPSPWAKWLLMSPEQPLDHEKYWFQRSECSRPRPLGEHPVQNEPPTLFKYRESTALLRSKSQAREYVPIPKPFRDGWTFVSAKTSEEPDQ